MKRTAAQQLRLDDLASRETALPAAEVAELTFLRSLESDEPAADETTPADEDGGTGTPDDELSDEAPADAAPTDAPAAAAGTAPKVKQSIFEVAMDRVRSRTALLADLSTAHEQLATMTAERDALAARVAGLEQRAAAGEAFATRVAELESERSTVSMAAARIAASSHVDPEQLPETSDNVETLDSVREQLATETDPKERSRLAKRAKALRNAPATVSQN